MNRTFFFALMLFVSNLWAKSACEGFSLRTNKDVVPVRVAASNQIEDGLFTFVLAVDYESALVPPNKASLLFLPSLESDFAIANGKRLSVYGSALAIDLDLPASQTMAPPGYDPKGRIETYYLTSPIQLPVGKHYYVYSAGSECDLGAELLPDERGAARTKFLSGEGKTGFEIFTGSGQVPQIEFSARDVWDYSRNNGILDSVFKGTILKSQIANRTIQSVSSIDIKWDEQTKSGRIYDQSHKGLLVSDALSGALKIAVTKLSGFIYPIKEGGAFELCAWIPQSEQNRVPGQKPIFDLEVSITGEGKIAARKAFSTNAGNFQSLVKRSRDVYPISDFESNLRFSALSLMRGQLRNNAAFIALKLAERGAGGVGSLAEMNAMVEASRVAAFQPTLGLSVSKVMEAEALLDAYAKISINLPGLLATEAPNVSGGIYRMEWPQDISFHIKNISGVGDPFQEVNCKLNSTGLCEYTFSGEEWKSLIDEGIWVKNERTDERLMKLQVEGSSFYRKVRGEEFATAKSNYSLSITSAITGITEKFSGYIDPRPAVSQPDISLEERYTAGWNHEKAVNGYNAFDFLILPSRNVTRLRVVKTSATFQDAAVDAPKFYTIEDFPWNPGSSTSTDWSFEIDKDPKNPLTGFFSPIVVNEFEIRPKYIGSEPTAPVEPIMGNPGEKIRGLKFASTSGPDQLIVPVKFYPNARIYPLYYGGDGEQGERNKAFAFAVADVLRSQHKIYLEVINSAVLKTYSNFPRSPFDAKFSDFLPSAFGFNNGIPLLSNFKGINEGAQQVVSHVGYVYSNRIDRPVLVDDIDASGDNVEIQQSVPEYAYGYEFVPDNANKPWEARVTDDVFYTSSGDFLLDQSIGTHYNQHFDYLLAKDIQLSKFGLYHSYSRPAFMATNIAMNLDAAWGAATGIGKLGIRASGAVFRGVVRAEAKEVLEHAAFEGFSLYAALPEAIDHSATQLTTRMTGQRTYFTVAEEAQKAADAGAGLVVKEIKVDKATKLDFDKVDGIEGLVAEVRAEKRPDIFLGNHVPRGPPPPSMPPVPPLPPLYTPSFDAFWHIINGDRLLRRAWDIHIGRPAELANGATLSRKVVGGVQLAEGFKGGHSSPAVVDFALANPNIGEVSVIRNGRFGGALDNLFYEAWIIAEEKAPLSRVLVKTNTGLSDAPYKGGIVRAGRTTCIPDHWGYDEFSQMVKESISKEMSSVAPQDYYTAFLQKFEKSPGQKPAIPLVYQRNVLPAVKLKFIVEPSITDITTTYPIIP